MTLLFGWCMSSHHQLCRVAYKTTYGIERACSCPCHTNTTSEET